MPHILTRDIRALLLLLIAACAAKRAAPPTPEAVVQRQVEAYNARQIDPFLATYAEDAVVLDAGKELMRGREQMRKIYGPFFQDNPRLHCRIVQRKVEGEAVFDQEHITGLANGAEMDAEVKYEVRGGLIRRVWILKNSMRPSMR
jgi:hypothetical protein